MNEIGICRTCGHEISFVFVGGKAWRWLHRKRNSIECKVSDGSEYGVCGCCNPLPKRKGMVGIKLNPPKTGGGKE